MRHEQGDDEFGRPIQYSLLVNRNSSLIIDHSFFNFRHLVRTSMVSTD